MTVRFVLSERSYIAYGRAGRSQPRLSQDKLNAACLCHNANWAGWFATSEDPPAFCVTRADQDATGSTYCGHRTASCRCWHNLRNTACHIWLSFQRAGGYFLVGPVKSRVIEYVGIGYWKPRPLASPSIIISMKARFIMSISAWQSPYVKSLASADDSRILARSSGTVQSSVMFENGACVPQRLGVFTPKMKLCMHCLTSLWKLINLYKRSKVGIKWRNACAPAHSFCMMPRKPFDCRGWRDCRSWRYASGNAANLPLSAAWETIRHNSL